MDQSGAKPQNNLPLSVQQQLEIAAQQVRSPQIPLNHERQQRGPQEERASTYYGPPPRATYPNRGRPRSFQPSQPSRQSEQLNQNRRGKGSRASFYQPQRFFTHRGQGNQLGPRPPRSSLPGHPFTAQSPSDDPASDPPSLPNVASHSSAITQFPSSSSYQSVAAEAFPALGSSQSIPNNASQSTSTPPQPIIEHRNSITPHYSPQMSVTTAKAFFERASTGGYRGNGHNSYVPQRSFPQNPGSGFLTDQNSPARGAFQPRLYQPATDRRLRDQDSHSQHDIQRQCQYLLFLVERETNKELNEKELVEKEAFRRRLEKVVQKVVADYAKDHVTVNPKTVKLKCYGSLASGFAVPGSDMDLLLMFPNDQGPVGPIQVESRRMIEKALLELGYGARLLTKTRVPILRVCQSPHPELLERLKQERDKWDEEQKLEENERTLLASGLDPNRLPSEITDEQSDAATATFAELDIEPFIVPLPPSPVRAHASLEYTANVGIQCDINFSNYVAIHNTILLRCYCKCDPRVRPMGLFVKEWSKARKINTPYHGTLSSYGYIMMVLHYLLNIAQPPVIPNLQHLARDEDAWNNRTNIELFEGFDVRFIKDETMLERRAQAGLITKNQESVGSLLRGFFRYYTDNGGFHWVNDVISIRTQGGLLTKKSKGWTEAKRAGKDNSIRLRYLFAIEDPFEIDHNIARTVGHSGIVAIRDEFRRAWNILSKVRYAEGRWLWHNDHGEEGEDLFAKANDRGDLLKQDQVYHKERMKKLREVENKREVDLQSAGKDRDASLEGLHGRFPMPSHPSGFQGHVNVCTLRGSPARSKLISSGRVVQDFPIRKVQNLQKNMAPVSKERLNSKTRAHLTNVRSTSGDEGYDVLKWIESTTEANQSPKIGLRGKEEEKAETSLNGESSQSTTGLVQRILDVVDSPTRRSLKSSEHPTMSKAPLTAPTKETSHANVPSEPKLHPTIDPKNPLSAWDVNTKDGRWLIWRDEKVREGKWRGITPLTAFGALNRQYPYDTARPLPDFKQQNLIVNVRARRNEYFQQQNTNEGTTNTGRPHESRVTDQERKDSAISIGKSKSGPQSGSCKHHLDDRTACDKGTAIPRSTSAFTLALSSNNPEVVHDLEPETNPVVEDPLAPICDPDPPRYRLDIPIPIASDFQFDPAQLRDLEIIAKGGSGCARDPLEQEYGAYDYDGFRNVELSNEWGGGGRMGEMVTDSGDLPVLDFVSSGPVMGRGDEEGLLHELPADW